MPHSAGGEYESRPGHMRLKGKAKKKKASKDTMTATRPPKEAASMRMRREMMKRA